MKMYALRKNHPEGYGSRLKNSCWERNMKLHLHR